jgi:hypothetical protein
MNPMLAKDKPGAKRIPAEVLNVGGTAAAILAVVAAGGAICELMPSPASPWVTASAYGLPAAIAFAAYCWISRRV